MTHYDIAMSAMYDAASRSMRQRGDSKWSEEDYNKGVEEFNRIMNIKKEKGA